MKFITTIFQKGNNLGIEVPQDIIDKLGKGKKPPVEVTIGDYVYKSTVAVMQGKFLVPLSSEHRKFVKVNGGDQLLINIEFDDQPRTIEIPDVLVSSLDRNEKAKLFFETLSPSSKKQIVLLVTSAKTDETLNRRLEKITLDLSQHLKP